MPSRILPLSEDAISQINSSKQITSLSGVVLALLENSLDAGATKVEVSVTFARGSCIVEDNGCGIPSTEFLEHGGLGKYHHTSKAGCQQILHGSTGTYLASLAALSMLSITSQHMAEDISATMVMHQGRTIARHLPSLPANDLAAFGTHGTRVSVNDLFGNMPVRVKQRALLSAQGSSTDDRIWLDLKRDVSALLLSWNMPCSVKLRDSDASHRNVTMAGSHSTVSSTLTERNLNTLHGKAVRYDLRDAFPLLFQAGLAPLESRTRWVPVSASTSKLVCHGLVCLDPSPTRLCQFVSIGVHPCSSFSGHSIIYETINKLFSNSSFGTVTGEKDRRSDRLGLLSDGGNAWKQSRVSKRVDRWPMFVLQCKLKDENKNLVSGHHENQLRSILDVLEAMIRQWLEVNHYRPQQSRMLSDQEHNPSHAMISPHLQTAAKDPDRLFRQEASSGHNTPSRVLTSTSAESHDARRSGTITHRNASPSKRQKIPYDIDALSKIKSGKCADTAPHRASRSPAPVKSTHFALPPLEPGSLSCFFKATKSCRDSPPTASVDKVSERPATVEATAPSDDFGSISEADLLKAASFVEGTVEDLPRERGTTHELRVTEHDDTVEWKDPVTRETFVVNSRTGIVAAKDRSGSGSNTVPSTALGRPTSTTMATTAAGRPLTLNGRGNSAGRHTPLQDRPTFLQDWQNPVFPLRTEQQIPIASAAVDMMGLTDIGGQCCTHNNNVDSFATAGSSTRSKLSKADLQNARVIRQVDAKFVLCSMCSTDNAQILVLVDQHAASERVILESLFSKLCSPLDATSPAANLRTNLNCASAADTVLLDQPLLFEVTTEEGGLFRTHAPLFARFGILYDLHVKSGGKTHHTLAIRALPQVIAERCRLFPKLLIDLLRSEIWSRVDSGQALPKAHVEASDEEHNWLDRIGPCPKGLIDMLNSRACRSAVMFNDVLSTRECEELMRDLAKCAFPFMCAHGRVSMVPIGIVGGDGESVFDDNRGKPILDRVEADEKPFSKAFSDWRTRERHDVAR